MLARLLLTLMLMIGSGLAIDAHAAAPEVPEIKVKAYKGFQRFVDEYGDS